MADEVDSGGEGVVDTSNMSVEEMNALQKQNCIFCKIAQKQIPAKILHEDDKVICILDINPASEGHILVYPKEHYMILPHIPEDTLFHMFRIVKLMSNTLLKTVQCKGTSIFVANGTAAGQKAPHVLIHVFPRREGDGLLELPKYELTEDQSLNFKKMMTPYLNQIFGKRNVNAGDRRVPINTQTQEKSHTTVKEDRIPSESHTTKKHEDTPKKGDAPTPKKKDETRDKPSGNKGNDVDLDDIAKLFGA